VQVGMYQHHRGRVREAHQLPQDKLDRRPALDARVNALPDVCRAAHVGGRLMVDAENEACMAGHPEQVLPIFGRGGPSWRASWPKPLLYEASWRLVTFHSGEHLEKDEVRVLRHVKAQAVLHVAGRYRRHRCVEVSDVRPREALLQPALHLLVEETALVRAHLVRIGG
jgi:hypothetical protein